MTREGGELVVLPPSPALRPSSDPVEQRGPWSGSLSGHLPAPVELRALRERRGQVQRDPSRRAPRRLPWAVSKRAWS